MMTRPDVPQEAREVSSPARITVIRIHARTWLARTEGAGYGSAWGKALATLDYRSHATTDLPGRAPTYWIDRDELAKLRADCERLGVALVATDDSALPRYAADVR